MTKKGIEKKLEKYCSVAETYHELRRDFDEAIIEFYGFHYQDRDLDWIIDALDYCGQITFEDFHSTMMEEKQKIKESK